MKNRSTPGPWFVSDQTSARNLTVEVDDGIACPGSGGAMSYTTDVCVLGWNGTPEWDANARLIAAAPNMLEALRVARAEIVSLELAHFNEIAGPGDTFDAWLSDNEALPVIDAAIARATGEKP